MTVGWAAAGNNTTTSKNTIIQSIPLAYTSSVTPWYHVSYARPGFIVGYYINPNVTPISQINFTDLKDEGITDIYVLANNENYNLVLPEAKSKAGEAGIRTNAWVFPGFKHASDVVDMKIGVQLDVETYNMSSYLNEIKAMRSATQGVQFSLTVKPDMWDGNQQYYLIAPYCDYIVPQLYLGDFGKGLSSLNSLTKFYNFLYPGKIVAGLQTYESYKNVTPISDQKLMAEIKTVQPNTRGVILFRYGLSNFNG